MIYYIIIAIICIIFLIILNNQKKTYLSQNDSLLENLHIEKEKSSTLEAEITSLRSGLKSAKLENAALSSQLSDMAESCSVVLNNELLPYGEELSTLVTQYGYTQSSDMLEAAIARRQSLIDENKCVISASGTTIAPGATACLLDAFNGYAYYRIVKVERKPALYDSLRQQIIKAFFLVNLRGESAMGIKLTKEYLYSVLSVFSWTAALAQHKKIMQAEKRAIHEREKEDARLLRESKQAQEKALQEQRLYEKALQEARNELGIATSQKEITILQKKIEDLSARLQAAAEAGQRALSMAQLTRKGFVYIISNIGSFGENVYKIGMTRRLDPMERIEELGVASVPFPFDVHAFIETDDAPALETKLHKHFEKQKINLDAELGREFYALSLDDIKDYVASQGLHPKWTIEPEAKQYRNSVSHRINRNSFPAQEEDELLASPAVNSTSDIAPLATNYSSVDEFISFLDVQKIPYVDKRSVGGCLWIKANIADESFSKTSVAGKKLYKAGSTRHFDGESGWFIK